MKQKLQDKSNEYYRLKEKYDAEQNENVMLKDQILK